MLPRDHSSHHKAWAAQNGIALILVLWVLTLLTMIALEFSYAMRTELTLTRNLLDETKAYYLARAGLNKTVIELIKYNRMRLYRRGIPVVNEDRKGAGIEDEDKGHWGWIKTQEPYEVPWEDGKAWVQVRDEDGKININRARQAELVKLVTNSGVTGTERDIIVDSILDWRDTNNAHRLNGAEEDYYQALSPPYDCKDGQFDTIEELLFVRGVTPGVFYGSDYYRRKRVEKGEEEDAYKGLAHLITIYSSSDKINLNTAPQEVLETITGITPELAQLIMAYRKEKEFIHLTEVSDLVGERNYSLMAQQISVDPPTVYSLESTGQLDNSPVQRTIRSVIRLNSFSQTPIEYLYWKDSVWAG